MTILGTPAEEDFGGKIDLLEAGAFADIDLVFMAHPAQQDVSFLPSVAVDVQVAFIQLIFRTFLSLLLVSKPISAIYFDVAQVVSEIPW